MNVNDLATTLSGVSHNSDDNAATGAQPGSAAAWALKWLNQNGVALEMRVAGRLLVTPSRVEHSGYYRDVTTGDLREFDVHAVFDKGAPPESNFEIQVVVECKATTEPWVLFMASEPYGSFDWDFEHFFDFAIQHGTTVRDLHGFPFASAFRTGGQHHAYQVAETAKSNTLPYKAVRQVLDAVAGMRAADVEMMSEDRRAPQLKVYVPAVITTSPLFEATLSPTGDIELQTTEIVPLFFKHRRSANSEVMTSLIWILHESATDQLVRKVLDSLNTMSL